MNNPSEYDSYASIRNRGLESIISSRFITLIMSAITAEFTYWTYKLENLVRLIWTGLLQACYLSFEVVRDMLLGSVGVWNQNRRWSGVSTFLWTGMILIMNIFKGFVQIILDYIPKPGSDPQEEVTDSESNPSELEPIIEEPSDENDSNDDEENDSESDDDDEDDTVAIGGEHFTQIEETSDDDDEDEEISDS